ncbi:hypothetical protein BDR06DRAFT_1002916 [Suillus hirtellus]|nr:hypothetical protein BDR06DRAFT_1002916 [Suillus hirtellus]
MSTRRGQSNNCQNIGDTSSVLVANGSEATSVAMSDIKFECTLMDSHMSVVDGEGTARYIKTTNAASNILTAPLFHPRSPPLADLGTSTFALVFPQRSTNKKMELTAYTGLMLYRVTRTDRLILIMVS